MKAEHKESLRKELERGPRPGATYIMSIWLLCTGELGEFISGSKIKRWSGGLLAEINFHDGKTYTIEIKEKS